VKNLTQTVDLGPFSHLHFTGGGEVHNIWTRFTTTVVFVAFVTFARMLCFTRRLSVCLSVCLN